MAAFGKERGYTDSGPSPPPRCVDALLFHVGERRSAAGYSCSTSGRTNVLSSTHRELSFSMAVFRSEDGVVGDVDTRWHSKSSLSMPPPTSQTMM